MKRLVIFDLDGTLINTIEDLTSSVNYALSVEGYPQYSSTEVLGFVGNGIRKLVERALPEIHRTPAEIDATLSLFRHYYDLHLLDETAPYPYITELLKQLTATRSVAVASNKYQSATERIIKTLFPTIPFTAIFGQREGIPIKPDPANVLDIMKCAEITNREEILYVGDSGTDMLTAAAAEVDGCAVTWGFRTKTELERFTPHYMADTPLEILSFLE